MKQHSIIISLFLLSGCTLPKSECPDPEAINYKEDANNYSTKACVYIPSLTFYSQDFLHGQVSILLVNSNGVIDSLGEIESANSNANCDTPGVLKVNGKPHNTETFILTDSTSSDTIFITFPEKGCKLIDTDVY